MEPVVHWENRADRSPRAVDGQLFVLHPGHLDVDVVRSEIGAVQQGARDPLLVATDHAQVALAFPYWLREPATIGSLLLPLRAGILTERSFFSGSR
jgi:hypothetical protein